MMKKSVYRWSKRILFVSLPLLLLLILAGIYVVDYYAKALTTAGGWPITGTPADVGVTYEDVTLTTADGLKISGWYLPGNKPYGVVVVHGIWANKQAVLPAVVMLSEAGYHVLTIDLRGHGLSEGERQSYGYYEALDVIASVDYLMARSEIKKVGVMGYSLGGSAVVRATALDERIKALVVESSFSSLTDAVRDSFSQHTGLPSWPLAPILVKAAERELGLSVEQINSKEALATMKPRPVMIIHGEEDQLFPVGHAYEMYEAAQEPKELWIIEGLTHDYPIKQRNEYQKRVMAFFETAFGQ
jgi:dipeptidyl aminopeptidase/acylaminoacyl peptidase